MDASDIAVKPHGLNTSLLVSLTVSGFISDCLLCGCFNHRMHDNKFSYTPVIFSPYGSNPLNGKKKYVHLKCANLL